MLRRIVTILILSATLAGCQSPDRGTAARLPPHAEVARLLGVSRCQVFRQPLTTTPGQPLSVTMPIEGRHYRIDLEPHSVRAAGYRVLVQDADGTATARRAGPVRTLRGTVRGRLRSWFRRHSCGIMAPIRIANETMTPASGVDAACPEFRVQYTWRLT